MSDELVILLLDKAQLSLVYLLGNVTPPVYFEALRLHASRRGSNTKLNMSVI